MILFVGVPPPTRLRQALLQPAGVVAAWAVARRRGTLFVPLYTHFVPLYTQLCLFSVHNYACSRLYRKRRQPCAGCAVQVRYTLHGVLPLLLPIPLCALASPLQKLLPLARPNNHAASS